MSDFYNPSFASKITETTVIDSRVNLRYFVDYAEVIAVSVDKKTVDVRHCVQQVLRTGEAMSPTETPGVELLFPASASFAVRWPVAVGDPVLLVGLRDRVSDTSDTAPTVPKDFRHYSRETLKAIPLSAFKTDAGTTVELTETSLQIALGTRKMKVANDITGFKSVLDDLTSALTTFGTGLTPDPVSLAAKGSALVTAMGLLSAKIATLLED